jgi:hypothetical protein
MQARFFIVICVTKSYHTFTLLLPMLPKTLAAPAVNYLLLPLMCGTAISSTKHPLQEAQYQGI